MIFPIPPRHRFPFLTALSAPVILAALVLGVFGCNSGSDSGSDGGDRLTAKIEGKAFAGIPLSLSAQAGFGVPGAILMVGSQTDGGLTRSLTFTIYNVYGPGEYLLGGDMNVYGGNASVGESMGTGSDALSWITPSNGRAGKLMLKSIGSGRLSGSFEYTTVPGVNNATGTARTVTGGAFDLPYKGTYVPAAENKGGRVSATLNKQPYSATSASGSLLDFTGQPGIQVNTLNSETGINLILQGVTDTGTFALNRMNPTVVSITGGRNGGTAEFCCWQSANAGSVGSISVTSITAARIKGTFTATLKPTAGKPATGDLLIENGTFDVAVTP